MILLNLPLAILTFNEFRKLKITVNLGAHDDLLADGLVLVTQI